MATKKRHKPDAHAVPGLRLVKGARESVDTALLSELRAAHKRAAAAAEAVERHNALGQTLQAEYLGANAVVQHVYEKVAARHKLAATDGVDVTAGVIKRGHFAADASSEKSS